MRRTGAQYLFRTSECTGYTACSRVYGCVHSPAMTDSAVCGALRRGLSSTGHSPRADRVGLGLDRDHRLDEPLELGEVFGLGRLDHERARDRERHGRRVESVVDEPLRDVVDRDPGLGGERAQVEDALVCDEAVVAGVEHREVVAQTRGDEVRREHRGRGGLLRPSAPIMRTYAHEIGRIEALP